MFGRIRGFFSGLYNDISTTFIWIFAIGLLFCAVATAAADEENKSKFKKGLVVCIAGIVIFVLGKPLVDYVKNAL